jgi:hypothetical protein
VVQTRFVVNFREPRSGQRKQFFFERYKDAILKRDELLSSATSRASLKSESDLTVAKAVEYWLQNRRTEVKVATWYCYRQATRYIVGPLLTGSRQDRKTFTQLGRRAEGTELIEMLGPIRIADLTTANIRQWHKTLSCQISVNTANVAKKLLQSSLALVAEDFEFRVPALPTKLGRRRMKPKKRILTSDQIALLLQAAIKDRYRGIYYAFPFMTGTRRRFSWNWDDRFPTPTRRPLILQFVHDTA